MISLLILKYFIHVYNLFCYKEWWGKNPILAVFQMVNQLSSNYVSVSIFSPLIWNVFFFYHELNFHMHLGQFLDSLFYGFYFLPHHTLICMLILPGKEKKRAAFQENEDLRDETTILKHLSWRRKILHLYTYRGEYWEQWSANNKRTDLMVIRMTSFLEIMFNNALSCFMELYTPGH